MLTICEVLSYPYSYPSTSLRSICPVCGYRGDKGCGRCRAVSYCGQGCIYSLFWGGRGLILEFFFIVKGMGRYIFFYGGGNFWKIYPWLWTDPSEAGLEEGAQSWVQGRNSIYEWHLIYNPLSQVSNIPIFILFSCIFPPFFVLLDFLFAYNYLWTISISFTLYFLNLSETNC